MLELLVSDEFKASLDACPPDLKRQAMGTVRRLRLDPGYPGLRAHRLNRVPDKWECYIDRDWRIIYDWEGEMRCLW